ncbi:creatininase family protein [Hyphomicrobium sp.]|uniref:creatininase family protein n=1 Tax=Hyphomicrobium sp. TaxID=82 RepID=UPI000F9C8F29|nr:creatininase family protein [Hyphomicrobium sp.]RUO99087.1 MAG: creatininase family protein [Hyphomicrobium sp.]
MKWADRTWCELPRDLREADCAAILPVGATEQHGPHLGTGMDFILAEKLCEKVSKRTGAPMLPTLPYGCSLGHSRRWPGTIALQPITLITIVKEIGDWAYHSGVRRLFIVNSHVTNAAPLRCSLEMLRAEHDDMMVAVVNTATISERVRAAHFADAEDWHANAAETALMLAEAPAIVRTDLLPLSDDQDRTSGLVFAHPVNRTSLNGVTGFPSRALVEDGRELFDWMVEDLSALIEKGKSEKPPLDFCYFGGGAGTSDKSQ